MNGNILDNSCWFCRQAVPAVSAEHFGKDETSEPGVFVTRYVHAACLAAAEKAEQANKA